MLYVSKLCHDGITVCATVHSPSPGTFQLFGRLLLLLAGKVVYFGENGDACVKYFLSTPGMRGWGGLGAARCPTRVSSVARMVWTHADIRYHFYQEEHGVRNLKRLAAAHPVRACNCRTGTECLCPCAAP